jgi:hypothetical protein
VKVLSVASWASTSTNPPTSSAPRTAAGYKVNGAKKEGDIIIAISAGTGGIAAGTAVKFAGDDNQYLVVAATSSTITISAPGLRQDLADQADVTVLSEFVPNMAFDRNAFLLAAVPRQCLKVAIPLMT